MSYVNAAALQSAIYAHLSADPLLFQMVGNAIYDALPAGTLPQLYIVLGAEDVRDASDKTGRGADHALSIVVYSASAGFVSAKSVAEAICDCLADAALPLARGHLVSLQFTKARASRSPSNDTRQVSLTFRARVADDT
jgi:hypothetical protein